MDPVQIIEKFGIPIAFCLGLAWFIYKQNKYIQDDLTKDIHQKFNRLWGIYRFGWNRWFVTYYRYIMEKN